MIGSIALSALLIGGATLYREFVAPPDSCKPDIWLFRLGENTPDEVIASDFAKLKAVGIGGVCIYGYNGDKVKAYGNMAIKGHPAMIGKVRCALREARKNGLRLSLCIGPVGCADEQITPEFSAKHLVVTDPAATNGVEVGVYSDREGRKVRVAWEPNPEGWSGLAVDPLSRAAFDVHWTNCVQPILDAATAEERSALTGVMCDSWEAGKVDWTQDFPSEFQKRRGYEVTPALLAHLGLGTADAAMRKRLCRDYDLTLGELFAENHYAYQKEVANRHGLLSAAEACGPHQHQGDIRRMQGFCDVATGEFWMPSKHRPTLSSQFLLRDSAASAHVHGIAQVSAEAFTTMGTHWIETPATLKPCADRAFCDGLTHVEWHGMLMSVRPEELPGDTRRAGAYYSPKVTWFPQSVAFNRYLARCSRMLGEGRFAADCLVYAGDAINVKSGMKRPSSGLGKGFDYDYCPTDVLLQARVEGDEIVLPCGMRYRHLKVVGKVPAEAERKVKELGAVNGRNRKLSPDCLLDGEGLDWIHRISGDADIYFVANLTAEARRVAGSFRVPEARCCELWDAVEGTRSAAEVTRSNGLACVNFHLPAYGSTFVVFPRESKLKPVVAESSECLEVTGPWKVSFDPRWGGPKAVQTFAELADWTQHADEGIRHYSGTAIYRTTFDAPGHAGKVPRIGLGSVKDVAEVFLNGEPLGVVWTAPWEIGGGRLREKGNELEIRVTNTWVNRLVGDADSPRADRFTVTDRNPYTARDPLLPSGLLGPVRILFR